VMLMLMEGGEEFVVVVKEDMGDMGDTGDGDTGDGDTGDGDTGV